ncbi:MAG: MFS transporter [Actinomycetota bacterium]
MTMEPDVAVTEAAPAGTAGPDEEPRRAGSKFLASPWLLVASAILVLGLFGWNFLLHPTLSAPTRDPAWYTWRAQLLTAAAPSSIVREWGPFGMFSGGYRVSMPLTGAWLMRMGGIHRYSFSILVMVGIPTLGSLALAAFAWRHRRDPVALLMTFLASAALFLTIPYVGYMDNVTCLWILALTLPFMRPAREGSWGARSAIVLLMFVATITHPTTTAFFSAVLIAGAALHLVTSRLSIRDTWRSDAAILISAGSGVVAGLAMWKLGAWGVSSPFADAALPPPYPMGAFKDTLWQWVGSLKPVVTGPLAAVAIGSVAATTWRERKRGVPMDEYPRMSLLWLLPLLGLFGWVAGLVYPYYRFFNTTLAIMLLTGMGAWVATRWAARRSRAAGVVVALVILAGLGFVMVRGFDESNWNSQALTARFLDPGTRSGLAAAQAYVENSDPRQPVVFVIDYRHDRKAWGWAKTFSNVARSGLEGDEALRSAIYFGDLPDFLANRPSGHIDFGRCTPAPLDRVYDCVSAGFFRELRHQLAPFHEAPAAILVGRFNVGSVNEPALARYPKLAQDVAVVTGPNLAPVDDRALAAGRAAGRSEARALATPDALFAQPLHILRVLFVLALLLVAPGLIAMRWFQLEDFPSRLALVPGISFAMTITAAFLVKAVHRTPFGVADGVASVVVACGAAGVLHVLARRRERGRAVVVPFARRAGSLFANRNFGALMGAVFLAVLGDGVVQGALAKTIAFGGKAGFSLDEARSPRHILGLVLLTYLPYMVISPFMGVVIDRFDRRKLLVLANGFRAAVIVVIGLGANSLPDPVLIGALVLTLASTRLVLAIKSAAMPSVLGGRNLMQGNSISQAGQAVFQLAGAGFALVGTKLVSAGVVIVAGAIVYAVGAGFASRTRDLAEGRRTTRFGEEARRILRDVAEGIRQVGRRPPAALGVVSFLTLRTLVSFGSLVFALQAREILGGKSSNSAVIIAGLAAAVGAAMGFVAAQMLKDRVAPPRLIVGAMVTAGVGFVALGGVRSTLGLSVVAFVAALGYFVGKISADTIMQQSLPDQYRGRGFSFFDVAYNLAWIAPALVLFALWSKGGARALMIGAGVLFLAGGALTAAWARRLGRDAFAPPGDPGTEASPEPEPGAGEPEAPERATTPR